MNSSTKMSDLSDHSELSELTIVAFDTETSGPYPVAHEIVEMGAVKWEHGKIVDEFQALIKPSVPMGDAVIKIHGITNEMVANAPPMVEVLPKFHKFLGSSAIIAHHAPFDLGFLTYEFEKAGLGIPNSAILCTSLLSRSLIKESANHRLQTLIPFLSIPQGTAHRALDDAKACLAVGLECFKRLGPGKTLSDCLTVQGKSLMWANYFLVKSGDPGISTIVDAIKNKKDLDMIYQGGSAKGTRRVSPLGIVRNPDGDFLFARCHLDQTEKRFYLQKIKDLTIVFCRKQLQKGNCYLT